MADVLGTLSFLDTPDVNGALILTESTGINSITGTADQILISGALPSLTLGLANDIILPGTASMTVPNGTTAQRPTGTKGMLRYNSTLSRLEAYDSGSWLTSTGVLDKSVVALTATTAAATTIFTYSVPGGTLLTNGVMRLRLGGDWVNASGAGRTCTVLVSYGGTTMWSATTPSLANGTRTGWMLDVSLAAANSASAQTLTGNMFFGPIGTPTTGTTGVFSATTFASAGVYGTSAFASAGAGTLLVSVAFSGATPGYTRRYYTLEKL